jgi:transposase
MCPIRYYEIMRQSKDARYLRLKMVQYAHAHGGKPAARVFGVTVKTVRKWLRRYEATGYAGLSDRSRAPLHPHRRVSSAQRRRAIALKKKLKPFGAARIKRDFALPLSVKALRRIWREEGLLKRKRKKPATKNDLRAVKAAWRLFEQTDLDTKHLYDIPEYWAQMRRLGLPKYQYTAREVVSGVQFLAYGDECCVAYADLFADEILAHLRLCGVRLEGCRFQTDNGAEFIGSWQAKTDSAFTRTVQAVPGLAHTTIPPAAHTWQADVETVHRLIEDEFYEVEAFASRTDFFRKAALYNLWFNVARKNSYKNDRTPWQIIHERDPTIAPLVAVWTPIDLDKAWQEKMARKDAGGYDVVPYP